VLANREPTSQHSEKNLRIECDYGCSRLYLKSLNNQKILQKTQKGNNLLKTKRILKMKYKLMGWPVFTRSLPGGAILPSSPVSYATACATLKSHASVWCVAVCHSSKTYSFHYKVPLPSPRGCLLCANLPQTKLQAPQIEITGITNQTFLSKFGCQALLDKRKDPYWRFSGDGSAKFYGSQEKLSDSS